MIPFEKPPTMKKTGITWIAQVSQCVHGDTARMCVAWSLPAEST